MWQYSNYIFYFQTQAGAISNSITPSHNFNVLILGAESAGKSTICRHMRHINDENLDITEIFHLKKSIRAASVNYFANILPEFINSENIAGVHEQQCKIFLEGLKASSKINRKTLDAALKIWRIPSFQDYLQELMVSEDLLDEGSMRIHDTLERCHIEHKGNSTSMKPIHSDNPSKHFLKCYFRIISEGYIPTLEDTLALRIPTTGNLSIFWFI